MPNEEEVIVNTNEEEETVEETPKETEKPQESLEDRRARLSRQLEQVNKKLGVEPEKSQKTSKQSSELDYGQKAFLSVNGIKGSDELALVKEAMESTGKSLDEVLENKYFQSTLNDLREAKVSANAIPSGSKRSGQSSVNDVEYWIAKGELPTDRELRTKVVNARIAKEKNKNIFTD